VNIRTDDHRKIEVGTESPEAAVEFLDEFAAEWEKAIGPLLRHSRHIYLTRAIYSIQVEGEDVYIYFRDYSVSFAAGDPERALALLAELTGRWQAALDQQS